MTRRVDARGYLCPMPTVLASLNLEEMAAGETLELLADDPTTKRDLPAWCAEFGHDFQGLKDENTHFTAVIRKSHAH